MFVLIFFSLKYKSVVNIWRPDFLARIFGNICWLFCYLLFVSNFRRETVVCSHLCMLYYIIHTLTINSLLVHACFTCIYWLHMTVFKWADLFPRTKGVWFFKVNCSIGTIYQTFAPAHNICLLKFGVCQVFSWGVKAFNVFQVYQYFTIYRRYIFLKFEYFSWISCATLWN